MPVGEPVADTSPADPPRRKTYQGKYARLVPVNPEKDVDELFSGAHGDAATEALWTYMPYGPFENSAAMGSWLESCAASEDPFFLTVHTLESGRRVGMVSFLNFVLAMRTIELGHIWYQPEAQRSSINTESVYLMLCQAFDVQRSRRVEWKCNALNARSRAAALRLGFSFEGIFRQHLIVKGRNRDSAWFSMLDREWPEVRANMESWLYGQGTRPSLSALNAHIMSGKTPD
ncbi:MAG: GNAT family N-acetyltransferase [Gammaproteobacteria bacterium]|nr:GNAT family N-acetyltransferase [Gammaproteobacteria bacterium]MDH3413363.1 GNAT family N-acetyltransferase [Gammaproteobacteria bacterium]